MHAPRGSHWGRKSFVVQAVGEPPPPRMRHEGFSGAVKGFWVSAWEKFIPGCGAVEAAIYCRNRSSSTLVAILLLEGCLDESPERWRNSALFPRTRVRLGHYHVLLSMPSVRNCRHILPP